MNSTINANALNQEQERHTPTCDCRICSIKPVIHPTYSMKNYPGCLEDLSTGANLNRERLVYLIHRAHEHRHKEEYDQATALLAKAIRQRPVAVVLYDHLCEMLIETEAYDEALNLIKKSRAGTWDLRAFELAAAACEKAGRYTETNKLLDEASANGHHSACLSNLKGLIAYHTNDIDTAMDCFNQAIDQDDGYGPAYANVGLMIIERGDTSHGLALLEQGFCRTPWDAQVLAVYQAVIAQSGYHHKAEKLVKRALDHHPNHKQLNYFYIEILLQQRSYEAAMAAIERAMAIFGVGDGILEPAAKIRNLIEAMVNPSACTGQGISLCMIVKNEEKNLPRALFSVKGMVDEMVVVDTGSSDHTRQIAEIFGATVYNFLWNEDFAEARNLALSKAKGNWIFILDADEQISPSDHAVVKKLIDDAPDRSSAYTFTTRNYVDDVGVEGWQANQGEYAEERGIGWYPSHKVRLFPNLPSVRFKNAVHEKVEESLDRSNIRVLPIHVPIHHFGDLDTHLTDQKKRTYYQLGQKKVSDIGNFDALVEHAIQAGEIGDFENAVALWSTVLDQNPGYAKGYFNLGYAYINLGRYGQAMQATAKAHELDPELKEATLNLSLCELRSGDVNNAIQLLERFLERYPDHPMATGNLAVAYLIDGRMELGNACLCQVNHMGFDSRDFVNRHIQELNAAGQPDRATALSTVLADHVFGKNSDPATTYRTS